VCDPDPSSLSSAALV